jgi:deferrochelatase/peroxidase EfeB
MKDIQYPGLYTFSTENDENLPLYSNTFFEKLLLQPPVYQLNNREFDRLLGDLQANILKHHNRKYADLFFITINKDSGSSTKNVSKALNWINGFSDQVTNSLAHLQEKNKDNNIYCLYFTAAGYHRLGLEYYIPEHEESTAFSEGMRKRCPVTFDKDDWDKGIWRDGQDIHFMFLVASDTKNALESNNFKNQVQEMQNWASVEVQRGMIKREKFQFKNENGAHVYENDAVEWFGYRDGISQPMFFPDLMGKKAFLQDDLSPLRTVLVKDKGGNTRFSAGSFMAFIKIEQDVPAFKDMERLVAAHVSLSEIECLVADKTIGNIVQRKMMDDLIEFDSLALEELVKMAQQILPSANNLENRIQKACNEEKIINHLLSKKIDKLVSIKENEKPHLIEMTTKYYDGGNKKIAEEKLGMAFNQCLEILGNKSEVAFLKNTVIDNVLIEMLGNEQASNGQLDELKEAIAKTFFIKESEKAKLIHSVAKNNMVIVTPSEIIKIIEKNKALAEAYIMGRFRNGTSVALSDEPDDKWEKRYENGFSYNKVLATKGTPVGNDSLGQRCPFASHVRKANPRDGSQTRIMARRGMLYDDRLDKNDPIPTDNVGMLFMSFQSSIVEQFEYVMKRWLNQVNYGPQSTGVDLIAGAGGNRELSRWYLPVNWGSSDANEKALLTAHEIKPCIKYKGGEYFFAPSISFIKNAKNLSKYFNPAPNTSTAKVPLGSHPIKKVKILK